MTLPSPLWETWSIRIIRCADRFDGSIPSAARESAPPSTFSESAAASWDGVAAGEGAAPLAGAPDGVPSPLEAASPEGGVPAGEGEPTGEGEWAALAEPEPSAPASCAGPPFPEGPPGCSDSSVSIWPSRSMNADFTPSTPWTTGRAAAGASIATPVNTLR